MVVESGIRRVGRRDALDAKAVEERARCEGRCRELRLDPVVDRLRGRRVEAIVDPEHRRQRLAQPEAGRRQREEPDVVGERLPDGAVAGAVPAEPQALERNALRVEHPPDVVVVGDEEGAGSAEPRRRVGEERDVDVPVRADDRQVRDLPVQLEPEGRRLDVAVGPQIRHSPSPGFAMSIFSASASSSGRYRKPTPSISARDTPGPGA